MSKSLLFNFLRLIIVVALSVISLLRVTGKKLSALNMPARDLRLRSVSYDPTPDIVDRQADESRFRRRMSNEALRGDVRNGNRASGH